MQEYDAVDPESEITVTLSGAVFMRLNQLALSGLKETDPVKLIEISKKVREGKDIKENSIEYHMETLLYISGMLSQAAVEQKKTKKITITNTGTAQQTPPTESKSE
jgi:hypothetical protein